MEQTIVIPEMPESMKRCLCYIKARFSCHLIESLDVFKDLPECQTVCIDLAMDEGEEYKGIVRTWRITKRKGFHKLSFCLGKKLFQFHQLAHAVTGHALAVFNVAVFPQGRPD